MILIINLKVFKYISVYNFSLNNDSLMYIIILFILLSIKKVITFIFWIYKILMFI